MSFSCFDNSNFDYNALNNKPCVNGCVLSGDMSFEDMGLTDLVNCCTQAYIDECFMPQVECCLSCKQNILTEGLGISILDQGETCQVSVAADSSLDCASENAVMNCTVAAETACLRHDLACSVCCLEAEKQGKLEAGNAINITCCRISVCVDSLMSSTSENPVMNCTINQAIDCIMSCGYQAGNGIDMTTDECGNHVISLSECVNVCCDLKVAGCTELSGPLLVCGDIYQCGSAYCTHAEEVYSKCDCIFLRDGAVSPLGANECSGFVAKKYNGTDDAIIAVDSNGTWRLGETDGDPRQAVATRAEAQDMLDCGIAVWNGTAQCFETASSSDGQTAVWDDCVLPGLSRSLSANHTKIKGEVTNSDKVTMHDYKSFSDLDADIALEAGEFSRYDNVAGVSCCFQICNVHRDLWSQCDCCVDYSTLYPGEAVCAETCYCFKRDNLTGTWLCSCAANAGATDAKAGMSFTDYQGECCDLTHVACFMSCDEELYDELETFTATKMCTQRCIAGFAWEPNTTGVAADYCYSSANAVDLPSCILHCVQHFCYYTDDLGTFCDQCTYYCYDSGTFTYCVMPIDTGTYVPNTYFFRCEDSCVLSCCYDLYVGDSGSLVAVTCPEDVLHGSGSMGLGCMCYANSAVTNPPCVSCCLTADTMCMLWDFKHEIACICSCVVEQTVRLDVCEAGNGRDYLVHTYGLSGCYLEQTRTYMSDTATRHCCCCLNNAQWTDWTDLSRQSAHVGTARFIQFDFDDPNRKSVVLKADTHIPLKIRNSRTGKVTETRWLDIEQDTSYDLSAKMQAAANVAAERPGETYGRTFWLYLAPAAQGGIELVVSTKRDYPSDINPSYTKWNTLLIGSVDTLCWDADGEIPSTVVRCYDIAVGVYSVGDCVQTKTYSPYDPAEAAYAKFYTRPIQSIDTTCTACPYAVATMDLAIACFKQGDILPEAIWSCGFYPDACCWGGMAYVQGPGTAMDIYTQSGCRQEAKSVMLGCIVCCRHIVNMCVDQMCVGKCLMDYQEFMAAAEGSPSKVGKCYNHWACGCSTGGNCAANCQRIVSDIGVEDMTGSSWQASRIMGGGAWAICDWCNVDARGCFGQSYGLECNITFGGDISSAYAGPRALNVRFCAQSAYSNVVARGTARVVCRTTFPT